MRRTLVLATILVAVSGATARCGRGGPAPGESFGWAGVVGRERRGPLGVTAWSGHQPWPRSGCAMGAVLRWTYLRGTFGVPAVAWDGSTGGLTRNGRRLVLSSFPSQRVGGKPLRNPPPAHAQSALPRDAARRLRLRRALTRRLVAVSAPVSRRSPQSTRYAVRVLNLNTKQLYPGSIVDRREPDEKMTGIAVTRAESRRRSVGVHALLACGPESVRPRAGHRAPARVLRRPALAHQSERDQRS